MGGKIFAILLLIIGLSVVVFVARSGIVGSVFDFAGKFDSNFGFPTSTPDLYPRTNTYPKPAPKSTPVPTPPPTTKQEEIKPAIDPRLIPPGFSLEDLSPYFKKIRPSISYNQISLSANFSPSTSLGTSGSNAINISGWELKAENGSLLVPKAVNIYDPLGLAAEGDITLRSGETFRSYYGQSAIGVNFRLNKCIGYLENANDFNPSLPRSCPNPVNDFNMSRVSGACQDYINSLSSCRLPDNSLPVSIPKSDYVCQEYLDQINMRGCYDRHRFDPDFLSREWRGWFKNIFLDPRHDTVYLLDNQKKLVDVYSY